MIRKITTIMFEVYGNKYFPERYAWVYLEGTRCLPDYEISTTKLEKMAFGC